MRARFKHSLSLVAAVIPFVAVIIIAKLIVHHYFNAEFIPVNAIFSALIGANVFLMGFLISGILSDYKESEKIPGEIAAAVLSIADEIKYIGLKSGDTLFVKERFMKMKELASGIKKWLHKEARYGDITGMIDNLSEEFLLMERYTAPNYIARLKQEQNNLRKLIIRVHTIRETDFIFSGYFIAATTTFFLIFGMIFMKIEPFYESLFFVALTSYLMIYLLKLIRDLDNPFGYYEKSSMEDVSLHPINKAIERISENIDGTKKEHAHEFTGK
jgi:predicted membrane chloride channel (bestrophin family)